MKLELHNIRHVCLTFPAVASRVGQIPAAEESINKVPLDELAILRKTTHVMSYLLDKYFTESHAGLIITDNIWPDTVSWQRMKTENEQKKTKKKKTNKQTNKKIQRSTCCPSYDVLIPDFTSSPPFIAAA